MKQKIIIKLNDCDKCRKEAIKIAGSAYGVESVAFHGPQRDSLLIIGDGVDAAGLTMSLRAEIIHANLETVEEVKDIKIKAEDEKKNATTADNKKEPQDEKKKDAAACDKKEPQDEKKKDAAACDKKEPQDEKKDGTAATAGNKKDPPQLPTTTPSVGRPQPQPQQLQEYYYYDQEHYPNPCTIA